MGDKDESEAGTYSQKAQFKGSEALTTNIIINEQSLSSSLSTAQEKRAESQSEGLREGPARHSPGEEAGKERRLRPQEEERAGEIGDRHTFPRAKVLNSERLLG